MKVTASTMINGGYTLDIGTDIYGSGICGTARDIAAIEHCAKGFFF